ncbi:MAG: peptidylprolyl isomerase [Acidimicrobiia bacterium]
MKKIILLIVALALFVSACGSGAGEVAASVNGTDFTVGDVNALRFDDSETLSKDEFAQYLGFLIQWDIVVAAAEADFEISFTEEEIDEAGQQIYETNAEPGVTFEGFLEANDVSQNFVNKIAHLQLVEAALGEALIDDIEPPSSEDIEAQREAAYDNLIEVCVSHILVETEAESNEVFDRLDAGETFAGLAMELSTDQGTGPEGGDLGCSAPTRYVPEFMDATLEAEVDVPYGPVESEFGFHAVLVTERTFPTDDELPTDEEIIEGTKNAELPSVLSNWINEHLDSADVTVNEKYGTWQTNPAGVVAPSDGDDTTTTTAPADATTTTGDPTVTTEPHEDTTTTAPAEETTTTTVDG